MQNVGQVSLPMRIALAATLAFSAFWFVALRPKPPVATPPATPPAAAAPQSAPGKAAAQAEQAAGASQQKADKQEAAVTGAPAAEAPAAATRPAQPAEANASEPGARIDIEKAAGPTTSKAALSVLQDVVKGKVAVVLFWDRRLSDDRAVHRAVMGLDRRGGKVTVHKSPIANLAAFEPITSGVPVVTSPTVLIIDRAGRARTVGGLTVPSELEELVGKALRVKP